MAAAGFDRVLDIHHALFGNTDQAAGLLDAGEHILHHGAALVHDQRGGDAVGFKPVHDMHRTKAIDLLAAAERKIDILFGLVALRQQMVGCRQHTVKGDFGIQRTASPDHAVLQNCLKGGLAPTGLVHGHHIVVRHQHARLAVLFAGPGKQQSAVGQTLELAGFKDVRVQLRQLVDELLELRVIFQLRVGVGHRLEADEGAQVFHRLIAVKDLLALGDLRGRAGLETRRAHQHLSHQQDRNQQKQPQI